MSECICSILSKDHTDNPLIVSSFVIKLAKSGPIEITQGSTTWRIVYL